MRTEVPRDLKTAAPGTPGTPGTPGLNPKKISASFGGTETLLCCSQTIQSFNPSPFSFETPQPYLVMWLEARWTQNRRCMVYVRLIYNHLLYIHCKNQLVMSASNTGCPSKQKMRRFTAFIIGCIHENLKMYAKKQFKRLVLSLKLKTLNKHQWLCNIYYM